MSNNTDYVIGYRIDKLVKGEWVRKAVMTHTRKGRLLKSEHDALQYGYGIRPTNKHTGERGRCRLGECNSKSGARFRAVKVRIKQAA